MASENYPHSRCTLNRNHLERKMWRDLKLQLKTGKQQLPDLTLTYKGHTVGRPDMLKEDPTKHFLPLADG